MFIVSCKMRNAQKATTKMRTKKKIKLANTKRTNLHAIFKKRGCKNKLKCPIQAISLIDRWYPS